MKWLSRLPEVVRTQPLSSTLKAGFKALVIVLIPWMLLHGLIQYFAGADTARRLAGELNSMTGLLSAISSRSEPRLRFDAEFRNLAALPFPSPVFSRRLQQLIKNNPGALEVHLFDEGGESVALPFLPVPARFVARRFLECVRQPELGTKYERFVMQFSGYRLAHKLLNQSPESIVNIGSSHDRHWGGWFRLINNQGKSNGCLIVFIRKSAMNESQLLDSAILQARRLYGRNYLFAWQDPVNPQFLRPEGHGLSSGSADIVAAVPYGESTFNCDGCPGVKLFTEAGAVLVARRVYPVFVDQIYRGLGFAADIVSVIALIILTPLFIGVTRLYPGLKMRISALMLFGAGIPLVLLIFTGIADRTEQEKVLVDSWQKRNIEELTLVDEGLSGNYRVIESLFKKHIDRIRDLPENEFQAAFRQTGHLLDSTNVGHQILLVSRNNSYSFSPEFPAGRKTVKKDSMVIYGEMLLEILNGTYDEAGQKNQADLSSVVNNMGGWLARSLILNSGKVGLLNLLGSVMPTYIDFFVDAKYHARGMVFAFLSQSALQRNYLFEVCRAADRKTDAMQPRFAAVPVSMSPFWPAFPKRATARQPELRSLADQVLRSGIPAHAVATVGSGRYLISAMRGSNLDGYVLIMARPYEVIARKISVLRRNLQILAVMVVLLSLAAAWLTSALLLQPLGILRVALEAVAAGNFRMQLPGATVSEFAAMLGSLDRTMMNFQELQVARSVQETLWPEESMDGEDWHLCGRCITATELGGDHYDWLRLADGRILLTAGDVTGHGIAPAMIQASIKVWIALNAGKCASAVELLGKVASLHYRFGARKLFMTCWLGYYTPASGRLEYASAGHPYPFVVGASGEVEMLKSPGIPLGMKERPGVAGAETVLVPGSSLVLYTDGIVETADTRKQIIGFDGFARICAGVARMPAPAAVDYIFAAAGAWGPQTDDQTVIVLHRNATAGAPA